MYRHGLANLLASLGIAVCGEATSGRGAVEQAGFALPDLVIIGRVSDGTTLSAVERVLALNPRPRCIGLFAAANDTDAARSLALGVTGVGLRSASVPELADMIVRVLKDEIVIVPALHAALAGIVGLRSESPSEFGNDTEAGWGLPSDSSSLHDDRVTMEQRAGRVIGLSGRELEMLGLLAQGRTNREIAATLSISLATVKTHLVRLYAKLEVGNRNEALARATGLGLLR